MCEDIYIDNTQQKYKKRMDNCFYDILCLLKNRQKSYSYAAHFEHHFNATTSRTDPRKYMTCSRPRRPLFLHALSIECTSKLCINFLNQFSVYFHILKMHYIIQSLNCVVHKKYFQNILQLLIKFTHSFVAIELLTFCKNAKMQKTYFIARESSHYSG